MPSTLSTHDLTKSYSGRTVVRGVSIDVASGEIVGLLGPNGAGKTTTFYMTVGLTSPDTGRVVLDSSGKPLHRLNRRLPPVPMEVAGSAGFSGRRESSAGWCAAFRAGPRSSS